MAYNSPDQTKRQPGKAVLSDISIEDANNTDDLNTRTNALEGGANKVRILNEACRNAAQWASSSTFEGILDFVAESDFSFVAAVLTQFSAGTSGTLEIDILKAPNADSPYVSMMNVKASIASQGSDVTVADYTLLSGDTLTVTINGSANVLTEGSEWTAATSNDATADSLQAAITALTGVTAANPPAAVIDVQADNTFQVTLVSSDNTNLSVGQTNIAGENTKSDNADFPSPAVLQGEYIRIDISSFQTVQKKFHVLITAEVS